MKNQRRPLIATYRLQLTPEFGFDDARKLVPYFRRLGVSHLYLSPITEAAQGSTHGYDVVDHNSVRAELGGRQEFERLREEALAEGLGLILDFVPNHVAIDPRIRYFQDVLAHGQDSAYAHFFDIDWEPPQAALRGKILLPFLGKPLEEALEAGELSLVTEDGSLYAAYFDHRFAIDPATFDFELPLSALLERQHWRLADSRKADAVNYRRFFNINGLIGLRQEDERVFEDTHRLLFELREEEGVDGVRIDHIDGLADPHEYLHRLRERTDGMIWVEKILAPGEDLPWAWPVEGTTGYEFMNNVMQVLLYRDNEELFENFYEEFVGDESWYEDVEKASKRQVMDTLLKSDLDRLARRLLNISEIAGRNFTEDELREALRELVASFGRYRTYLPHDSDEALRRLDWIIDVEGVEAEDLTIYHFIRDVLLGTLEIDTDVQHAWTSVFQQFTSPVAAKGVEDTAFYRYVMFAALNEVGGAPGSFGLWWMDFHLRILSPSPFWGRNLLASATHDHKRGEDTRMRLLALAELPSEWKRAVAALEEIAHEHVNVSPAHRYLFYQTLAALWKGSDGEKLSGRLWRYMEKAAREGKEQTSWLEPDSQYESALEAFVREVTGHPRTGEALEKIAGPIARLGFASSLSQTLLKYTLPGVPDLYQGAELLDLSLVDPDNRRPVDYSVRQAMLDEVEEYVEHPDSDWLTELIAREDPKAKLYFIRRLLWLRRQFPAVFEGGYQFLHAGKKWLVYARADYQPEPQRPVPQGPVLLTIVPRFPHLHGGEANEISASLPDLPHWKEWRGGLAGTWRDALTGATLISKDKSFEKLSLPIHWAVLMRREK